LALKVVEPARHGGGSPPRGQPVPGEVAPRREDVHPAGGRLPRSARLHRARLPPRPRSSPGTPASSSRISATRSGCRSGAAIAGYPPRHGELHLPSRPPPVRGGQSRTRSSAELGMPYKEIGIVLGGRRQPPRRASGSPCRRRALPSSSPTRPTSTAHGVRNKDPESFDIHDRGELRGRVQRPFS